MKKLLTLVLTLALVLGLGLAPAMAAGDCITGSAGAEDTFGSARDIWPGYYDISVSGTWVGTVTLQRSWDGGTTWYDVAEYTANFEGVGQAGSGCKVRLGIKSGDYTSGTATLTICQRLP
ncbi:MAG: hypothetical protein K9K66_04420 [Desulfarculaceae bacterium]|nr:hypothetical protein [Desulfarculaceae bacterium]MCF8073288.1 hypothetical protein [Desulfarculaceae bacterium]MCF8100884.1 hypothetical protein [Desulfarculaceae bacterium]MCF8116660.1 hypothetical protein [Desulfarculaceae bacterium]